MTPAPDYYSRGERMVSQLQALGIRAEAAGDGARGVSSRRMEGGLTRSGPARRSCLQRDAHRRHVVELVPTRRFKCGGFDAKDFFCVKGLDDLFAKYLASYDRNERKKLAEDIQRSILQNYYLVPVIRQAFINCIGPRIAANKWQDVFPTITTGYAYPGKISNWKG